MALSTKVHGSQSVEPARVHYIVFLPSWAEQLTAERQPFCCTASLPWQAHTVQAALPPFLRGGRASKLRSGCVYSVFSAARRDTVRILFALYQNKPLSVGVNNSKLEVKADKGGPRVLSGIPSVPQRQVSLSIGVPSVPGVPSLSWRESSPAPQLTTTMA